MTLTPTKLGIAIVIFAAATLGMYRLGKIDAQEDYKRTAEAQAKESLRQDYESCTGECAIQLEAFKNCLLNRL